MTRTITEDQGIVYSIEEVTDSVSVGLSDKIRDTNLIITQKMYDSLEEGESWPEPRLGRIYVRRAEGFEIWTTARVPIN